MPLSAPARGAGVRPGCEGNRNRYLTPAEAFRRGRRASATPARVARPAPLLCEHTPEVLEELGSAPPRLERLAAAGAVQLGAVQLGPTP